MASSSTHLSFLAGTISPFSSERIKSPPYKLQFRLPNSRFRCSASKSRFFTRLSRLIKEKAKSDVEKVFSGFSTTRENLAVLDELLLFWNLAETDRVLDELEEALLVSDFGPKITVRIVERLRDDIMSGKLKSGSEIKDALKGSVLEMLAKKNSKTELQMGFRKPAVIMIVGVNGGGKTQSLVNGCWLAADSCSFGSFSRVGFEEPSKALKQSCALKLLQYSVQVLLNKIGVALGQFRYHRDTSSDRMLWKQQGDVYKPVFIFSTTMDLIRDHRVQVAMRCG